VATGASVLPIRVAGWQRTATGSWSIYATTDQVVEGLEQAVDPNQDGDAHDAARVALVALAEPYASFPDDPLARAVQGASHLDMLVVTPAGNDGDAGASYGSIGGPGGAKDGLTVGALDRRVRSAAVRVVVRSGLRVLADAHVPLGTEGLGHAPVSLPLVAVAAASGEGESALDPVPIERFFDRGGFSTVAGRAVLAPAGANPDAVARNAASAGAGAVILYGATLPAGGIGLDTASTVPVVSVDARTGQHLVAALAHHERLVAVIGAAHGETNAEKGRVASFSSRGLALGGTFKPELAARGVELATSEPGPGADGSGAYGTVTGTSAAAAIVAGAAALLVEARPDLSAAELRSALVQAAHPLGADPLLAQGAGELDLRAAADLPAVALPAALDFGRASRTRHWHAVRMLAIRNTTGTQLSLYVTLHQTGAAAALILEATPGRVVQIPPHRTETLSVLMRLAPDVRLRTRSASGILELRTTGRVGLRVPWTVELPAAPRELLGRPTLSKHAFRPSDAVPAVLAIDVGRVLRVQSSASDGPATVPAIVPVSRFALDLWNESGQRLGTLATLTDVLPGRYTFGITGRSPAGADLEPGRYTVRIIARPVDGSGPSIRVVRFTIAEPSPSQAPTLTAP
jgi:hypothetical protein